MNDCVDHNSQTELSERLVRATRKVVLAGVENANGAEASSADFGGDLDQGIFVATSERTHNLLIFNWKV